MENLDIVVKDLVGKDENKAQKAADYLVNNTDVELFKMLVAKSDYLFDFVKLNVNKRLSKAINKDNFKNLIKFFEVYSCDYDDLIINKLAENADEDLTDEILELLENGTMPQKTYAAKYFSYIPDTISIDLLSKYAFSDDEGLSFNSAEALGQMRDDISFDIALSSLNSDDDFERLKAVKFFVAYGRNYPMKEIIDAMKKSQMPENIAGQIPYMMPLTQLLRSEYKNESYLILDNIISGLGEILPVADIFQFELYEILEKFIQENSCDGENSGKKAKILLKSLIKFGLFIDNSEYLYDESKDTKQEVASVLNLLKAQNSEFWRKQKEFLLNELSGETIDIISVLPVIVELNLTQAVDKLKSLLKTDDEILLCEILTSLQNLNALSDVDIKGLSSNIKNENIKAIVESLLV